MNSSHPLLRSEVDTYLGCVCLVASHITTSSSWRMHPSASLPRLVSIQWMSLMRIGALFFCQSISGPPTAMVHRPPNANASVFAAPLASAASDRGSGLRDTKKTGLVVAASFHGFLLSKGGSSPGLVYLWCPHEKMALCPKVPSPPGAEFLCDSSWAGAEQHNGSRRKQEKKSVLGCWPGASHQLEALGGTGSKWRMNWVCVYTLTWVNTHLATGIYKHTLPSRKCMC